jgi:hypothetical protein
MLFGKYGKCQRSGAETVETRVGHRSSRHGPSSLREVELGQLFDLEQEIDFGPF